MVVNHIISNINVVYLKEEGQQVASLGQVYNPFLIYLCILYIIFMTFIRIHISNPFPIYKYYSTYTISIE